MIQPFDPNIPKDCSELLQLLSFQTGHNPATHAGAYALDRAYPAKFSLTWLSDTFKQVKYGI
jgi:hypothetical protein